jgi:hypothetical protein
MTAFLARHFPAWDRRQHRLSDVMRVVAMAFCNVDTANAANNEAAEMYALLGYAANAIHQTGRGLRVDAIHARRPRVG